MKFFKHFVDASDGRSMQALMNKFGLEGYAAYFILMELCAKKFEKPKDREPIEDDFRFVFNQRVIREKLRMRSTKVELLLNYSSTLVLLQFTKVEQEFHFYVPKLLEYLDKDSKRARTVRDNGAPKIKIKDKDKEIYKENEDKLRWYATLSKKYVDTFENVSPGVKAEERFFAQIMTQNDADQLSLAIDNYKLSIDHDNRVKHWRSPKKTFQTFLGTKSSGFFWRDHIVSLVKEPKASGPEFWPGVSDVE